MSSWRIRGVLGAFIVIALSGCGGGEQDGASGQVTTASEGVSTPPAVADAVSVREVSDDSPLEAAELERAYEQEIAQLTPDLQQATAQQVLEAVTTATSEIVETQSIPRSREAGSCCTVTVAIGPDPPSVATISVTFPNDPTERCCAIESTNGTPSDPPVGGSSRPNRDNPLGPDQEGELPPDG